MTDDISLPNPLVSRPPIHLRHERSRLERFGVDLEYFPDYRNLTPSPHCLDIVLLSLIIRGHGWHFMDDDAYEEHGGSLGITHYGQSHTIVTDRGGMEVMNIYLDPARFALPRLPRPLDAVLPELIPLHPSFQHRLNRIVRIQFDDPAPVVRLAMDMHDELQKQPAGCEETLPMMLSLLLVRCCRHVLDKGYTPSLPAGRATASATLEELRRHIDHTCAHRHTLDELAKRAGLSRTYLCRAFRQYTGKTVFEYLLDRRIELAINILRTSNMKLLGVAEESGFHDLSFFTKTFRTRTGMTPGAFRNRGSATRGEG